MALIDVPLSGQSLNVTRVPINTNFLTINTAFAVNHVVYNDGSGNQGKHFFIEFPIPASTPTTAAGEVGLYSRTSTLTSQPELVFAHQSGSTAPAAAQIVEFTSAGWAVPGWCRLPSGILMKWGFASAVGNVATTVTFPTGGSIPPFSVTPYAVLLTPTGDASSHSNGIFLQSIDSNLQFKMYAAFANTKNVYYLAIGI